jgi:phosphatidylglycerophosphate synthase
LIVMICGKATARPRILGKVATVLQMIMVLWTLLRWYQPFLVYCTLAAAVCTGISGLLYVWDGMRQLSASPKSLPTPKQ